jgi:hypothetical protein
MPWVSTLEAGSGGLFAGSFEWFLFGWYGTFAFEGLRPAFDVLCRYFYPLAV